MLELFGRANIQEQNYKNGESNIVLHSNSIYVYYTNNYYRNQIKYNGYV